MNDVLPDRPVTWQEALLAGAFGLALPGPGLLLAGLAGIVAARAGQRVIAAVMGLLVVWNVALIVILLSAF